MDDQDQYSSGQSQPTSEASTGPRTEAGKAASSRNAIKHGMYADGAGVIRRGPFAEGSLEVADFLEEVVNGLQPQNAIEEVLAARIARLLLRDGRIDRFETKMLSGAGRLSAAQLKLLGDEDRLAWEYELGQDMGMWLDCASSSDGAAWVAALACDGEDGVAGAEVHDHPYEDYARFLAAEHSDVTVGGLRDGEHAH